MIPCPSPPSYALLPKLSCKFLILNKMLISNRASPTLSWSQTIKSSLSKLQPVLNYWTRCPLTMIPVPYPILCIVSRVLLHISTCTDIREDALTMIPYLRSPLYHHRHTEQTSNPFADSILLRHPWPPNCYHCITWHIGQDQLPPSQSRKET